MSLGTVDTGPGVGAVDTTATLRARPLRDTHLTTLLAPAALGVLTVAAWQLAITHLSLGAKSRELQLGFLAELLANEKRVVLMGDFNCPHDAAEMRHLYKKTNLRPPPKPVHTFPSWSPDRALDHVLTAGFDVHEYQAVPAAGSDHMAVAVELTPH